MKSAIRTLLLGTAFMAPVAAWANEPGPAAAEEAAAPSEALGDIVVTAQKRSQSAQQVGIALTALSGDELAKRGIQNVSDVAGSMTNVQVNLAAGMTAFNIRGMGSNDFSTNFGSPVAVHVDEIYISKVLMNSLILFDIDRFEGLKGPQGTLFGRNTTGGSMNIYTRKPTDSLKANASVEYGNYDTYRAEAGIGGPIAGNLTGRIAGFVVHQGDGFYRNLLAGGRDGAERKYAVRAQLAWSDDRTKVLLSGHYGKDKSLAGGYELLGPFTPQSVAAGTPAFCQPYLDGTLTGGTPGCVLSDGRNEGDNDPYTLNVSQFIHKQDNTGAGGLLRVDHDMGWATLTSLTGVESFSRKLREHDGPDFGVSWRSKTFDVSEEVRLTSSGDRTWNYVLGGYFAYDRFESADNLLLGPKPTDGSTNAYSGDIYSPFTQTSKALAVFFHNEIKLTDELRLIAGLRWSREHITIDGATFLGSGVTPAVPPAINGYPTTILATLSTSSAIPGGGRRTDENVSFKTGVQWKPKISSAAIDDLMIYANVSTGFRSGGFNAEFVTAQSAFTSLAPEEITAYEAGFKSRLAGRRLQVNGAIFRYDFRNGFINADTPGALLPITQNAASIRTVGAELDIQWVPIEGLNLSAGGGWLDSKITSNITASGLNLKGNRPINTAKWTFNGRASYEHPITDDIFAFISADGNYRSSQFLEIGNEPISREKGYWVVNGQIGIENKAQGWTLSGWVKNLTKSAYRTYANDLGGLFGTVINIYGPPRTYGVKLSFTY